MLISYPVLPAAAIHDDEDIYLARIVEDHLLQHEGTYPVSTITTQQGDVHRWHGGVHLHGGGEPIRAIADGTVVAFRFAEHGETYGTLGAYDTGFVLLRHETETGENTPVIFYSLYMHFANQADLQADRLSQLPRWLRQSPGPAVQRPANQRVWRKEVLGFAGQLYNREAMHFEVFMLDADFQRVWRDSTAITEGTGSNDWFGDAHFVIPQGRQFAARHPRAATAGSHRLDFPGANDFPLPLGREGQNAHQLFVSVSLQRGRRIATTYRADGRLGFEQVGTAVVQDDYEYELYRLATALYPDCASAGLEWLRFGRVLGSDTTTRNENWQLVRYGDDPLEIGYIDLAPQAIAKLSDADFPHWHGWERREEGDTANAGDGICDDAYTLELIRQTRTSTDAAGSHAARKLQHLICKAPSEWDDADLATRFARLREAGQPLEADDNWNRFRDHVGKMAFWQSAGLTARSVWHFHPLRFIRQFRTCGWLGAEELVQALPRRFIAEHHGTRSIYRASIPLAQARARTQGLAVDLSKAMRRYGIGSPQRQAIFLANAIVESSYFAQFYEGGRGAGARYGAWYGRGIIQITWEENYLAYFRYRGRDTANATQNIAWRDQIETDAMERSDSAGFWWVRNAANLHADDRTANLAWHVNVCENFDWRRRTCAGETTAEVRLSNPTLDAVGRLVNTGGVNTTVRVNGLAERRDIFSHVQAVLGDVLYPDGAGRLTLAFPTFFAAQR
jgi:predicted chitinase